MLKHLRWSALLTVLVLVLAACSSGGTASPSAAESMAESAAPSTGGGSAAETCDADEFGCVEIADGDPIVLGTALVITGPDASLGLDSQYGAQVAVNLVNADGGVLGHDVELNNQDDGCSADGGTSSANLLRSIPEIVAVVGTSCSSAGVPASQILSEAGILIVSPSNTAPSLTVPESHQPFYMRTAHNDKVQGAAMAEYACDELGVTTAATIYDESPYAEQLQQVFVDNFAEKCGGTTSAQESINSKDTEFSSLLATIATSNGGSAPEFLYYPIFTAAGALITQQAKTTSGLEDTILAGADGLFNPDFLAAAGDAAEGMYLSGPDLDFAGDFYEQTFKPEYTNVSGEPEPISVFHAHAFDAVNIILAAARAVAIQEDGVTYIPRTALKDAAFETSNFAGITGTLTCDENGDCADPKISVSQVQDGAYVRIWP